MLCPFRSLHLNRSNSLYTALLLVCFSMLLASSAAAQKWNRYGPGTRSQASSIYDPSTKQMIMFGGQHAPTNVDFHDVWAVKNVIESSASTANNLNWVSVTTAGTVPSVRFGHSAAYNPTSNRMIIFGGGTGFPGPCANDLWVLTHPNSVGGTPTWTKLSPTGTLPPVREGHASVYDAATNTMIVFGGTDCAGNYYNDVWILSNADGSVATPKWTQSKSVGTAPAARSQSTAIYDSTNRVMTLFGSTRAAKAVFNDVGTLANVNGTPTWTQLAPTGTAPNPRSGHTAVYDSANNRMIIHGGVAGSTAVAPRELGGLVGLQAQHLRVRVRVAPVTPGNVPVSFAHFPADEERGMQINPVAMRERDEVIELLKGFRIVIPGARLKPGPEQVQPHRVEAEFAHLDEVGFDILRIPLLRPLPARLGRNPVRAYGNEPAPLARKIVALEEDPRQGLDPGLTAPTAAFPCPKPATAGHEHRTHHHQPKRFP